MPGITIYLKEVYITYSNESKMKLLDVKGECINAFSVIFAQVLSEMANGGVKNCADVI